MRMWLALAAAVLAVPVHAITFVTEENPPLNFMKDGQVAGISTAVLREMAKRARIPVEFSVLPWSQAYASGLGKRDVCVYSTVRNAERGPLFQWIGPIARGEWSLFALPDSPLQARRADELRPYRIGVQNDARVGFMRERGFTNLVVAERTLDLAAMLTSDPKQLGRIDLWMTQTLGAADVARAAGVQDIKLVFGGIMNQDYWLACNMRTSMDIVKSLQESLNEMRKDGTHKQLTTPK